MRAEDYFGLWVEQEGGVSHSWRRTRACLVQRWALPVIGSKDLNDIESPDLVAILDSATNLKTSSRNKVVFSALRGMLREAVMRGHMKTDVFATLYARVRRIPEYDSTPDPSPLTLVLRDQVLTGFKVLHPASFPFVAWQFFCGTRASEALGLKPEDIHVDQRMAVISNGWVDGHWTPLKSRRSRRMIPVPKAILDLLPATVNERIFESIVLRSVREREWHPLLSQLGIKARSLHSTRATCVSIWIDQGMSVADAAHLAGDKPSTIEAHYQAHIGMKRIAVEAYAPTDVLTKAPAFGDKES